VLTKDATLEFMGKFFSKMLGAVKVVLKQLWAHNSIDSRCKTHQPVSMTMAVALLALAALDNLIQI
jgi:hypothetical protein